MQHLEHHEQCAVFEWAFYQSKKYPCLRFLHASTAGEKFTNAQQASRAKKAGMRAGVPDIFLPYPNGEYAGLFIEMKRKIIKGQPKPTLSTEQKVWLDYLNEAGYNAIVCYGAGEAITQIQEYLQNNQKKRSTR